MIFLSAYSVRHSLGPFSFYRIYIVLPKHQKCSKSAIKFSEIASVRDIINFYVYRQRRAPVDRDSNFTDTPVTMTHTYLQVFQDVFIFLLTLRILQQEGEVVWRVGVESGDTTPPPIQSYKRT